MKKFALALVLVVVSLSLLGCASRQSREQMQRLEAEQAQLSEEVERLREETDRLRSALDDELEKLREQLSALTATMQTTLEGLKERGEERARELGEKTTEVAGDQLRELLRTATEALRRINESLGETEKARE